MRLSLYALPAMLLANTAFCQQSPPATPVDTSYHLLWYKGKKLKPNVLLTPRLDTVTYIPSKGKIKVVSKAGVGYKYDNMLAEIVKTPERIKEKMAELAARVPKTLVPHLAAPLEKAYNQVRHDYEEALSNNIELPKAFTLQELAKPGGAGGAVQQRSIVPGNDVIGDKTAVQQNAASITSNATVEKGMAQQKAASVASNAAIEKHVAQQKAASVVNNTSTDKPVVAQQKASSLSSDVTVEKPVAAQQTATNTTPAAANSSGAQWEANPYPETGILTEIPLDKNGAIILKPKDVHRLAQIREVLDYYERHKNDIINSVPQPPAYSFSYCFKCDSTYDQRWDKEFNAFIDELMGEDKHILQQIFSISRSAELLFPEPLFEETINLMNKVLAFIMDRADKRVRLLFKEYGDNATYTRAVISALLGLDRQQQLMGFEQADHFNAPAMIHSLEKTAEIFVKAMKEYDYTIILDVERILGMDRQFQLMGGKPPVNTYDAITFNQFKMEFQITGKVAGDKGYQLAELKGKNWYAAVPDQKTCRLNWVLMGPDQNKLSAQLVAAELKGSGGEISYVGTKLWKAAKPKIRLDFCEGWGTDTLEAYTFLPAGDTELWNYPAPTGVINMGHMNTILTGCFVDVQRTAEKAAYFMTPGNVDKMKQEMTRQYETFMKNGGADMAKNAAGMSAQDMQKMMKMANAMNAGTRVGELVNTSNAASYLFKPAVRNKNKMIFKESLNGKELFPENKATVYAWFHVSLEQDPESPFKITEYMSGGR